jgi:hypothetical protein
MKLLLYRASCNSIKVECHLILEIKKVPFKQKNNNKTLKNFLSTMANRICDEFTDRTRPSTELTIADIAFRTRSDHLKCDAT